jgi:hypothetical protein
MTQDNIHILTCIRQYCFYLVQLTLSSRMRPTLHKKRILATSHFPDCVGNTLVLRKSRFDDVIVVRRRLRGKGCGSMFHMPTHDDQTNYYFRQQQLLCIINQRKTLHRLPSTATMTTTPVRIISDPLDLLSDPLDLCRDLR